MQNSRKDHSAMRAICFLESPIDFELFYIVVFLLLLELTIWILLPPRGVHILQTRALLKIVSSHHSTLTLRVGLCWMELTSSSLFIMFTQYKAQLHNSMAPLQADSRLQRSSSHYMMSLPNSHIPLPSRYAVSSPLTRLGHWPYDAFVPLWCSGGSKQPFQYRSFS